MIALHIHYFTHVPNISLGRVFRSRLVSQMTCAFHISIDIAKLSSIKTTDDILVFKHYVFTASSEQGQIYIFFPILFFLLSIFFNCLISSDRTSLAMLNKTGKSRSLSPLSILAPFHTEEVPLYSTLLRVHSPNLECRILPHLFLVSIRITLCIFSYSADVLNQMDELLNIKPTCIPRRICT